MPVQLPNYIVIANAREIERRGALSHRPIPCLWPTWFFSAPCIGYSRLQNDRCTSLSAGPRATDRTRKVFGSPPVQLIASGLLCGKVLPLIGLSPEFRTRSARWIETRSHLCLRRPNSESLI